MVFLVVFGLVAKAVPGDVTREGSTRCGPVNDVKSSLAPSVPTTIQNTVQALAPSPSALPLPVGLGTQAKQPSGIVELPGTAGVSTSGASPSPTQMFNAQAPVTTGLNQGMASPSLSRSSSTTSLASATGSSKKSTLNANAKVCISVSTVLRFWYVDTRWPLCTVLIPTYT